ncbi:F-box protein [Panicum miliaceum]|uniref:F-box protein n=1 Tax=Panicum miliaceum TaxID=4540 RepID=A0A3L6SE00_PANMI|nr:F-box protein [Panicum miliaceum]
MGHSKLPPGEESFVTDENENRKAIADEKYVWTYTSPEFPMLQPAVKIELLGRIEKQASRLSIPYDINAYDRPFIPWPRKLWGSKPRADVPPRHKITMIEPSHLHLSI